MKKIITYVLFVLCLPLISHANPNDFEQFLSELRTELQTKNINVDLLNSALPKNFAPQKKVITKLKNQPEVKFSFAKYFASLASDERAAKGRAKFAAHKDGLLRASKATGVPPQVITALWGIESNYGKSTGGYQLIPALVTLAYDSHRKPFFRKELITALKIVQEGHIKVEEMTGSWAGAMGQCQFMPTSFMDYAKDGNGDGKKDIWNTEDDVFASAGNYLSRHGWNSNQIGAQRVVLTKILPPLKLSSRGISVEKPISEWQKLGVIARRGKLQNANAKLFLPEGPSGRAWLIYNNFDVIMRWNNSSYFAISVLELANKIAKNN